MGAIIKYLFEVKEELSKVIWPKSRDVVKLTLMVFIISAVVGAYLSGLDLGFTTALSLIIK